MDEKKSGKKEKKETPRYGDAGKGDARRSGISAKDWDQRWEKIFGKKSNTSGSSVQVDK
jgi:hypothetical protein